MQISNKGISLIKTFEKCSLRAYENSHKRLAIGYGWIDSVDDQPICEGMIITQKKAEELFREKLNACEDRIKIDVTVDLKQYQFDALVAFAYGKENNSLKGLVLLDRLNKGKYKEAADCFFLYTPQNGIKRKVYERDLFLGYTAFTEMMVLYTQTE
ncbi:lysozyme [Sodalis sp. (in: enterobacteria)]|uniref:lysozyme n=1 Tax=Sodalis sp. (in: enterobacteria) TaxID=1898979 RepID=UPI003F2AC034